METQNFVIRETRFSDYEYFTKWECDENITKYMSFDENRSYEDVVTEALYSKKVPDETGLYHRCKGKRQAGGKDLHHKDRQEL